MTAPDLTAAVERDIQSVRDWLAGIPDLDMEDIAADGGVTVAMVVQQEAREMAGRLARVLSALQRQEGASVPCPYPATYAEGRCCGEPDACGPDAEIIAALHPTSGASDVRGGADRSKPAGAYCGHCLKPLWDETDHDPACPAALASPGEGERERIARIIDPEVWACRDRNPNSTPLTCHDIRVSLSKADAILGGSEDKGAPAPAGPAGLACPQSRTLEEPYVPARAIHYEEADVLEWIVRDVPAVAQATDAGDILLDMKTREPIGWRIYNWSKRAPLEEPESAAGAASSTDQVALQCRAVAHLARSLADVHADYADLIDSGALTNIRETVGARTARIMEMLGDILNGMDAVSEDDDWMKPVFAEAHRLWPPTPPPRSEAEPVQNPGAEGSRGEIARQVRRFTLSHAPDGFRLFRDGERIEGPWSHQDVELAEQAWAEAVADAILALSASPASPTVGGWRPDEPVSVVAFGLWVKARIISFEEGWWRVRFSDDSEAVVRPSHVKSPPLPAPHPDPDGLKAEGE